MRAFSVLHILGWLLATAAVAMLVPTAFAVALDPMPVARSFLTTIVTIGFVGGALILAFRGQDTLRTRGDSLLLLALVWLAAPLAGAMPLYMAGYPEPGLSALFEATSGFTTTGASTLSHLGAVPDSIIVWRAMLQWMGGLTTLLSIAAVLGPLAGTDMFDRQLRLIGRSTHGSAHHLLEAVRTILPLYVALTSACFAALSITGIPAFDAFCLALATISTGGFMPRDGTIAQYGAPFAELSLAIFMVLGALSIVWIGALFQGRWAMVRDIQEPFWIVGAVLCGGVVIAALLYIAAPAANAALIGRYLTIGVATAASWISTSGFIVSSDSQNVIPYAVLLIVCFIGGGRFSTAGGLKVHRAVAMSRQLGRELALLVYPHGIRPSRTGEEPRDFDIMKTVWTAFAALIAAVAALTIVLAATGLPFIGALLAAVSALANVGPAYEAWRLSELVAAPGFAEMGGPALFALSIGMILGRVEIVALAGLLSLAYWRQ